MCVLQLFAVAVLQCSTCFLFLKLFYNLFTGYEYNVDNQLRTVTKSSTIDKETLNFYKKNFTKLVREGLDNLDELKRSENK